MAAFAARLRDAVDLDTVRADLLAVVNRAVEPAHISVWTAGDEPGPPTWFRVADTYGVEVAPGQDPVVILAVTAVLDTMAHPER